jgi:hypothetical protein
MAGLVSGGAMGRVLTRANIAIRHNDNIAKNRITSVCSISASSNRGGLLWKKTYVGDRKGFIVQSFCLEFFEIITNKKGI